MIIRRRLFAHLAAAVLLLSATGCSFWPEPPSALTAAADAYAADARALTGVSEAHADVTDVDAKDKPGEWRVTLYVTAASAAGLDTVPDAVAALRRPHSSVTVIQVFIPGATGDAPVRVVDPVEGSVERAKILRALPFAASAVVSDDPTGDEVAVKKGTKLAVAIDALRESGTLATDPLDSVTLKLGQTFVAVSQYGPSEALADLIEELHSDPGVQFLRASEPTPLVARPAVSVSTDDPDGVAAALSSLKGDERSGRPRTEFDVSCTSSPSSTYRFVSGFVGLPLGSAKPDDLPVASPPPTDEAAKAAQLATDTTSVTAFLVSAAQAAGIPGSPVVAVSECSPQGAGSQVQGTLLLPVFEYADSADPAYDAITSAWESSGYTRSDQALGTSIYSPLSTEPVVQATIRGTSEGIRITAFGACAK